MSKQAGPPTRTPCACPGYQYPISVFVYGVLLDPHMLAWLLTGDPKNISRVRSQPQRATITGYRRVPLQGQHCPALIPSDDDDDEDQTVRGHVIFLADKEQWERFCCVEGECNRLVRVVAHLDDRGVDMSVMTAVWDGRVDLLVDGFWRIEGFRWESFAYFYKIDVK